MPRYHIEDNFNVEGPLHGSEIEIMNPIPNVSGNIFGSDQSAPSLNFWASDQDTGALKSGGRAFFYDSLASPGALYYNFDGSAFNNAPRRADYPTEEAWDQALQSYVENQFIGPGPIQRVGPSSCFNLISGVQLPEITSGGKSSIISAHGYPDLGAQSFIHGDVIIDNMNMFGGSEGFEDWRFRTDGLFLSHFQDVYGLYYGYDVPQLSMRRGFQGYGYYFSSSSSLPSSLEGYGLQYAGVVNESMDDKFHLFMGHHVWFAYRLFIVLYNNFNYSTMGCFVHNGVIEYVPVHTPSSSIIAAPSTPELYDYPAGLGIGYAEQPSGRFMRPGYASRTLNWDFTTIDFSQIEVPVTPGYSLRFDQVSETYPTVLLGAPGWAGGYGTGGSAGISIDRIEARGDFISGGSGWKVGSIATGGANGGLSFKNYYTYIVVGVLFLGVK